MPCKVVNLRKEKSDIYIGRGSKWGNPFKMKNSSEKERNRVCDEYEKYFWTTDLVNDLHELKDKVLGCYCKPLRCHGDFLTGEVNKRFEIDTKINLCDSCIYSIPECELGEIKYGDGFGNDNIIECSQYETDGVEDEGN